MRLLHLKPFDFASVEVPFVFLELSAFSLYMDPAPPPPLPPPPPPQPPAASEAHVAHAANPTPSHGPPHNHPPYAEMITTAIGALNERTGSSKKAIAKYIERTFGDLPPSHPALLTHHLKRLRSSGQVVMVKHSYMLPRSGDDAHALPLHPGPVSGPKRGRGRPPKPKIPVQPTSESVLVAVGLVDGPVVPKRGPGRPPKSGGVRGPRPKSLDGPKRRPGRPPKAQLGGVIPGGVPRERPRTAGVTKVKVSGRPRGRPPKILTVGAGVGGGLSVKRRGRPPKADGPKRPKKLTGRPVGRPRKKLATGEILPAASEQPVAEWMNYEDLKQKLEHIQGKIKLSVGVLRTQFSENNVSAMSALQELEDLATMDISAPLNIEGQLFFGN